MSSTTGYSSPVDLGLGRVPQTQDPELFAELTDVYNSIHLLNAYLNKLRTAAGGTTGTPIETMPFTRFYVSVALQDIALGDLVCPSSITGQNGSLKGALPHALASTAPECNFAGIALTAGLTGENFRVGVGPAAILVPGAVSGSIIWGYSARSVTGNPSHNGTLYLSNPGTMVAPLGGTVYPMPVGVGLIADYALIGKFYRR